MGGTNVHYPKKGPNSPIYLQFPGIEQNDQKETLSYPKNTRFHDEVGRFQYGTFLDLNMAYYRIELNPDSKRLCTVVLPWGKYEYQRLPMGLCNFSLAWTMNPKLMEMP